MIAYDPKGAVFALADGAELLLHDGESEAPLWRKTLDGKIVGLGASSERVVAITAAGTVIWLGARSGDHLRDAKIEGAAARMAVVDLVADRVVVVTRDKIVALEAGGAAKLLADHSAKAIAMRPDGTVVAVTEADELVTLTGGQRTVAKFPGLAIRAIAHHPAGFWVIGLAAKLLRWDGTGEPTHITSLPADSKLEHVCCSTRAIAMSLDRSSVAVIAWPSKDTLGSLVYGDRTVEGLELGPWPWLGVALDLGDGNKFNLERANLHRSDTHPGREHRRWLVVVSGGEGPEPAAKRTPAPAPAAPAPAPTTSRAGLIVLLLAFAAAAIYFLVR